jgi:hypothetical protein
MGDRANIKINTCNNGTSIWLYTHWNGYELPELLKTALIKAKNRWNDPSYGARILVDQITKSGRDEETGWGLDTEIGDNSYPVLEVDFPSQTVNVQGASPSYAVSFAAYTAIPDPSAWREAAK